MGSSDAALKTAFGQCQGCGMNEKPEHAVYLEGYEINTYEVTNKEYRQCMRAGICGRSESAQVAEEEYDKFPITDVNWFNAQKYCTWAGGRLPTEAEWEKAARGGSNQGEASPAYPWGNQWLPKAANADRGEEGNAEPVGSFDAKSPYGVSDTSGNVWEWVSDWYADSYYGISLPRNPTGPEKGTERVLRGGSFVNDAASARSMFRTSFPPGFLFRDVGFRCVRA